MNRTNNVTRILQVTDQHLIADKNKSFLGINTYESLQAVLNLVKEDIDKNKVDLLLFTGDTAQDHSKAAYENFVDLVKDLSCEKAWIPGNHDNIVIGKNILQQYNIDHQKVISFNSWKLILLNSHWKKHIAGKLTKDELSFLESTLKKHNDSNVMIFLHHPPISLGCAWLDKSQLTNSDEFMNIINKYSNIKSVVFGHVHSENRISIQKTEFISSPATAFQFLTTKNTFSFDSVMPGYRWFNLLDNGSFETGVKRVPVNQSFIPDLSIKGY